MIFQPSGKIFPNNINTTPRVFSTQLTTQAARPEIVSTQLITQANSKNMDLNQLMTLTAFPGNDSYSTHNSSDFQKYQFESTNDSSEQHAILSRLMLRP